MPEATFLCVDSSESMRNGDYFPTRLMAVQEACNLVVGSQMQKNPENTVGFLTMGGNACTLMETLTADLDRVMASLTKIAPSGSLHFGHGVQIASLALSHCLNTKSEKRVIAFVGSPITEDEKTLEKLGKKLRKDEVAVDVVAVGVEANIPLLEKFIAAVNKNNNSHLIDIASGANVSDVLLSSVIILGEHAATAAGGSGPGAGGTGFDLGVDPNMDPELAMVLRMSMEEERVRQATAAAAAAAAASTAAPPAPAAPQQAEALTEEDEMELALQMSMDPNFDPSTFVPSSRRNQTAAAAPAPSSSGDGLDPTIAAALNDPQYLSQLAGVVPPTQPPQGGADGDGAKKDKDDKMDLN